MAGNRSGDPVYVKLVLWRSGVEERPGRPRPALGPVRPSVVRDRAELSFALSRPGPVRLVVYDASGRLVRTLVSGTGEPGPRTASWDRRDDAGRVVPAGSYVFRLTAEGRAFSAKAAVPAAR